VAILGEPELLANARELTASVRANVTIDWTIGDNVRAQLRVRAGHAIPGDILPGSMSAVPRTEPAPGVPLATDVSSANVAPPRSASPSSG